ncbi:a61eaf90-368a-4739-8908-e4b0993997e0 [Sclerotinia trifoliorum]|uniref:A61eaf90-368a-4739-8908-e4b0993997e0 n=1 Tax=Sclerotinia trifoliorum TaxID=28548 RepID=A0A8H2ZSU7_9HELO|nr:a61eaf90-368a-4739-8908-e4b0993997e0 [Sclerotinia trifoliorum]
MPLSFPIFNDSPQVLQKHLEQATKPQYVIFFASLKPETNESWCGDCRNAEAPLSRMLDKAAAEERVRLVYAGLQAEWRDLSPGKKSLWREEPWGIDRLPTVVKVTGEKWEKLIEEDCYNEKKLSAFVEA